MAKRRTHVHQYHRIYPYGRPANRSNRESGVWACALPDCTHYMPHNVEGQVVGKLSLCNTCMEAFVLDNENMKNDKPICTSCTHPELAMPADFDMERHEAKSRVAKNKNITLDEVTEEQIEAMLRFMRLSGA